MNHANFAQTTLAAAVTDTSGTSITVTSGTGFPAAPFIIAIDTEAMEVTNVNGTTWTVVRGWESSTAATHGNGATIYHDISAAEADSIATKASGPASATDGHLAVFDGATGKIIKDGGAVPSGGGLANPLTADLNAANHDLSYIKLMKLNAEIDDGNSGTAKIVDWGLGAAHKLTLTDALALVFNGVTNLAIGATATANDYAGSATPGKAIDGNAGTGWEVDSCTTNWLSVALAAAGIATTYVLQAHASFYPKTWTVQGSNNGSTWTLLDTQTNSTILSDGTAHSFTIASSGSFSYYRLDTTAQSNNAALLIYEFQLLTNGAADPITPCFLTLKLTQDATGGRLVTWPSSVKGTPLYDLAANAVTVIQFFWDGASYWLLPQDRRVSVPVSATAKGMAGQWSADGSYFYYCSASNTWVRAALATWS